MPASFQRSLYILALAALFLVLFSQHTLAQTYISSVSFSGSKGNYSLTITGSGFGSSTVALPYTGDVSNFVIIENAETPNFNAWGSGTDAYFLTYQAWSNTSITVSGLGASPGDALFVAVWNASSGEGAAWGGNVPTSASHPQISSVSLFGTGQQLHITITGSGFGRAPVTMPFTGDLNYFKLVVLHGPASNVFDDAGYNWWGFEPQSPDPVTLNYTSWSNDKIVISGFAGAYGTHYTYTAGDAVVLGIWNTQDASYSGAQTAWGGAAAEPCTLQDTAKYNATSSTLTMNFTVGNTSAATWNAWLIGNNFGDTWDAWLFSVARPITNPPKAITKTYSDLPKEGIVGVLSTLTTPTQGIVCSSWVQTNTGTP